MNKKKFLEYKNIIEQSELVRKAEMEGDEEYPYYKIYTNYLMPGDDFLNVYIMPDEDCRFLYLHDQRNIFAILSDYMPLTIENVLEEVEASGMEDWGHGEIIEIKGDSLSDFEEALKKYFELCDKLRVKFGS